MNNEINKNKYPKILIISQTRNQNFTENKSWKFANMVINKIPDNYNCLYNLQNEKNIKMNLTSSEKKNIKVLNSPLISLSKARNETLKYGLKEFPETAYILFIDDDSYLYDAFLFMQSLYLIKVKFKRCLIVGNIVKPNLEGINRHMNSYDNFKLLNIYHHNLIMGSCVCIDKNTIKKINYFDENFGLGEYYGGSEETELYIRAIYKEIKIIYNPMLIVVHPPVLRNQYGFRKMYSYGLGRGALYKKYINYYPNKMIAFLIVSLISNFLIFIISISLLRINYAKRHLGLFSGKLKGFIVYKNAIK